MNVGERTALARLEELIASRGVDPQWVRAQLRSQVLETPSWGYGNTGTRFGVFHQPAAARDVHERLADAAFVHRLTGICPKVAIHIPWDRTEDFSALAQEAHELGVRIGSVNPNVFQDQEYKLGSLGNPDPAIAEQAIEAMLECIAIMQQVGSSVLSCWFADGTNYPGQDSFRRRKAAIERGLARVAAELPAEATLLLEYKPFEPAFYHTDIADWGMAYVLCRKLGPQAKVLVDLGHHLPGANIEHLVAFLLDEGMLGGFHFNNRKYADDDLTTGSINPYEVFLILHEIVQAGTADRIEFMIDQSHNLKPKLEAMITTVTHLQGAYARALIVDRGRLAAAQAAGDIVLAERLLQEAFTTDVEPLLREVRESMGAAADPLLACRANDYPKRIAEERGSGVRLGAGGWA